MPFDAPVRPLTPQESVPQSLTFEDPAPPVIQDVTAPMGSLTAVGLGFVNLQDLMMAPGSGEISSWTVAWLGGTQQNHFTTTNDGKSPAISGTGRKNLSGTYSWTVTATGPGGTSKATLTHTAVADAATIGNTNSNFPASAIGATPSTFYTTEGGRRILLAVGLNRSGGGVLMGQDFNFPGPGQVTIEYADPARPTWLTAVGFGGNAQNIRLKGLKFRGFNAGVNGHVAFLQATNCSVVDCDIIDTPETFNGTNAFAGIYFDGTGTTGIVIDNCRIEHTFRGLWFNSGSVTVTNCWFNRFHGQAVFLGQKADGVTIDNCVASNPYRTPGDVGNHMDFVQLGDAGTGGAPLNAVSQNVTVKRCMFVMGNANGGLRGFAGGAGGVGGPQAMVANLVIDRCIWTTWGVDSVEIYGFTGNCVLTKQVMIRMLSGDDRDAVAANAVKDIGNAAARLTIAPGDGNVDGASALTVTECWVENNRLMSTAGIAKTTFGSDYYEFHRTPLSAGNGTPTDAVGFAVPNPRAALESFDDWDAIPLPTMKGRLFSIFRRADGKGPVNATGDGWNT